MKELVLLVIFLVILFSYLTYMSVRRRHKNALDTPSEERVEESAPQPQSTRKEDDECCGQHAVCEKESLLSTKVKPDYYDDEELDVYAQRDPQSYTEEEISQFQDVLYTMKEFDVAGWLKSLQLRQIELPDVVKEEALMIVSERRSAK